MSQNFETILPPTWAQICTFTQDNNILGFYVDHLPAERVFSIRCSVSQEDAWSFVTFQTWLKGFTGFSVFLTVECADRGTISLPWPMKAKGLVGLKVSRCRLKDKYADVMNPDISAMADQLRVLDMRDSVWLSDTAAFEFMIRPEVLLGMTADYDCGQDSTLEYMVMSNVTDTLRSHSGASMNQGTDSDSGTTKQSINHEKNASGASAGRSINHGSSTNALNDAIMRLSQSSNISDTLAVSLNEPKSSAANNKASPTQTGYQELLMNIQSVQHTCVYEKLKVLDESCPSVMSAHHFSIMVQGGSYPEVRKMNYSFSGLPEIPRELREFRVYFPKLAYLDLTKNFIRHVALPNPAQIPASPHLSLDLRYNHITNINLSMIYSWAAAKDIYIDIRFNPIDCECHMNDLLLAMKKNDFFNGLLEPYKYLKDIACYSPLSLKGQKLSCIELSCSGPTSNSLAAEYARNNSLSQTNLAVLLVFCCLATAILAVVIVVLILYLRKYRFAVGKGVVNMDMSQRNNSSDDVEGDQRTENLS
ncbi:protein toll [Elysia marginata]|uniref:Protein toll n=1 Tax=Elysia marginata TaxID=1093978 RepID=A0AAV4EJ53_9GAST|nr:protein toll [Elysia marginata]